MDKTRLLILVFFLFSVFLWCIYVEFMVKVLWNISILTIGGIISFFAVFLVAFLLLVFSGALFILLILWKEFQAYEITV